MEKKKLEDKLISLDVHRYPTISLRWPNVGPTLEFQRRRCQPMPTLGQRKHASWVVCNTLVKTK